MVDFNLVQGLFWRLKSDSWYGTPCSRVSMTPAASPTPTLAQAQRQRIKPHRVAPVATFSCLRVVHMKDHTSGGAPLIPSS